MLALHASQLFFFLKIGAKVDRDFRVSIEKRKGMLALEGGLRKGKREAHLFLPFLPHSLTQRSRAMGR